MVEENNIIENSSDESTIQYNPNLLAELIKTAIGDRSISQVSRESNLSKTFISLALNAKLKAPPTQRTLIRFINGISLKNGVTPAQLFQASGYKIPDDMASGNINAEVSMAQHIATLNSDRPAMPFLMLMEAVIQNGCREEIVVDYRPDVFSISGKYKDSKVKFTGLSAFTFDDSVDAVHASVLTNIIMSTMGEASKNNFYFIITNNEELYEKMQKSLRYVTKINLAIVITDKYLKGFEKQVIISNDLGEQSKNEPEFPMICLNN